MNMLSIVPVNVNSGSRSFYKVEASDSLAEQIGGWPKPKVLILVFVPEDDT
jgi:hypothetical protein